MFLYQYDGHYSSTLVNVEALDPNLSWSSCGLHAKSLPHRIYLCMVRARPASMSWNAEPRCHARYTVNVDAVCALFSLSKYIGYPAC